MSEEEERVEDNKCAKCTFTRDHVDEASGELYVGCDGVYDGVVASCAKHEYIKVIGGSEKGYECITCPAGSYVKDSRTGIEECPEGHMCNGGEKTACPPNTYQSNKGQSECTPCTSSCGVGQHITGQCNATTNPTCKECEEGKTYCSDGKGYLQCTKCDEQGKNTLNPCTKTTDTTCLSNEITVYQNSNYSGSSKLRRHSWSGQNDMHGWWNDRISGFKKTAGASVGIHEHRGFKGLCTDLTEYGGQIDFTRAGLDRSYKSWDWGWWNDRISSISIPSKCEAGEGGSPLDTLGIRLPGLGWVPNEY